MGHSSGPDARRPVSVIARALEPVGFLAVLLCISLAACDSTAPSGSPSTTASAPAVATSAPPGTPAGPPATADDWPFFRGNAARTGDGGSGPKGKPIQVWRFQANGAINGALVVAGDVVYASSDDDMLHALDIDTGTEKWHFHPVNPQVSAPAYADGVIYAFDGTGTLFALDASTGNIRWQASKPLVGPSGPTISGGKLYVGTADSAIVALDTSSGSELWRHEIPNAGAVNNPSFADGLVYAGSDRGGLVVVDATTGSLAWTFEPDMDSTGSVVIAGGIAYIGGTFDSITGRMSALDAKTGQLRWQLDQPFGSPAVADAVAYEGDQTELQATDTATGNTLWAVPMERTIPTVANGVVYVPLNVAHRVDAFDAATGANLWHFDVDGGNTCCFALAHGSVFAATQLGSLYRIDGDGSTIEPGPTPPPLASPLPTASAISSPPGSPAAVSSVADFLWSSHGGDTPLTPLVGPGSMAIDPQGRLWVADTGNSRFAILNPDGTFVEYWEHRGTGVGEFILQRPSSGDGYGAIAFAPDGTFYVLDVGNFRVEHFDARRQLMKAWGGIGDTAGKFRELVSIVVDATGIVSVLDDKRDVVEHYDQDGHVLGSFTNSAVGGANALAIDSKGNFYVSNGAGNHIEKFSPSGELLLTIGPEGPGTTQFAGQIGPIAIDSQGRMFVGVGHSVYIFDVNANPLDYFTIAGLALMAPGDGFSSGMILDGSGSGYVAELTRPTDLVEKFRLLPPFAPTSALPSP